MKKINIGLVGLGTIGRSVLKILSQKRLFFKTKYDVDFNIVKICDKNPKLRKKFNIAPKLFTTKYPDVVNENDLDVVIELIGGINPAKNIILSSLKKGKDVITANKALLAKELPHIIKAVRDSNAQIRFEASVCGGIPIIKSLTEGLVANRIESVFGIINGTSNYILSKMSDEECSFYEALLEAKKKGFAERNPSLDIKGFDSSHKLSILVYLAFGTFVKQKDIYVKGIDEISPLDIRYAKELGLVIKLLAIAKRIEGSLEVRVHPTLISSEHPLASVNGVFNAVYVKGDLVGDLLFSGQGAGQLPTTSAILSDLVDLAGQGMSFDFQHTGLIKKIKKMDDIQSKYYIRLMVIDRPGVLSKISGILAQHKISIASVNQKERGRAKVVPVVMLTHEAKEKDMRLSLEEINKLAIVKKSVVIHREEI